MKAKIVGCALSTGLCLFTMSSTYAVEASNSTALPSGMRLIEGATFETGNDLSALAAIQQATRITSTTPLLPELSARRVSVNDFYMDEKSVTNA